LVASDAVGVIEQAVSVDVRIAGVAEPARNPIQIPEFVNDVN
jgi:hypothetical protein